LIGNPRWRIDIQWTPVAQKSEFCLMTEIDQDWRLWFWPESGRCAVRNKGGEGWPENGSYPTLAAALKALDYEEIR
jgi:hypothetical protein